MSRHYVITISRQFGTGGREIGKALGAALGVPYMTGSCWKRPPDILPSP